MAADASGMVFLHIVGEETIGEVDFDDAQNILIESGRDEHEAFEELDEAFWAVFAGTGGNPSVGWEENDKQCILSPHRYDTESF